MIGTTQTVRECEIIINRGVLICCGFRGSLKPRKLKFNKNKIFALTVVFETTNSRTYESMHFVGTMKIGVNK
jgi:hypothetical protein